MQRGQYNCDKIKAASQKKTNDIFIRYKTPILEGAIKLINQFKKDKDDGVHYKKLCEELNKYVKIQKRCARQEVERQGEIFKSHEWSKIVRSLYITLDTHKIKRLCYLEKDKDESTKKYILNIHEVFRNFCIEKKARLQNLSDMDFEECNEYLSWINGKKMYLQGIDPGYKYIEKYKEYFHIHDNCNYPWLLKKTPDITCRMTTRTRAKEREGEGKSLGDTSKVTTPVTKGSSISDTKDTPPTPQPSPKVEGDLRSGNTPNTGLEKAPTQSTPSADDNVKQVHQFNDLYLQGTPVDDPNTVPKSPPDKQTSPKYSDPEVQEFIKKHIQDNFQGQIIAHDARHAINRMPDTIYKYDANPVQGEAITPPITKPNNFIPLNVLYSQKFAQNPRSQRFVELIRLQPFRNLLLSKRSLSYHLNKERFVPPIIHPKQVTQTIPYIEFDVPNPKPITTQVDFIPAELIINPRITTNNKIKDILKVEKDPATPGSSHSRSSFMIYILVFLTISTAITILYLLSKYTSFGLLFNKKTKKKRLKRQLQIKKIPEESPIFDKITNYSVNDMPYENKTHDDNNIYTKIKIQKSIINKNISLPKKKKNKGKAIIDIHMEMLNECKNDEWELNKNDFLEICLEEFIREKNKIYSNSENTNLVMKNISIQNTKEDKMVLLDKWTERYRHIWEKFKSENAFKFLQYEWKKEEKEYLENIEQLENHILNENTKISYKEIKKEIWRKWITKQAKFIEQFTQETWFKSLVKQIEDVLDEYKMGEIKDDIFVLNIEKLDNINNNEELHKHDNNSFLIKVLTQIFMMVIEESIKEESPEKTELVLDNIIGKINKEKLQNIKSHHVENTYEKSKDHLQYNDMLEKDTHKYKDSFKELMEGWTNKPDIDINSADDQNKSDKWIEMTDKNFLNPNDDTTENPINYIRKE